jgi:hypothetical protein
VARTRLPPLAREIFPVIRAAMPWMETGAGHVELLGIRSSVHDNRRMGERPPSTGQRSR